ncbi:Alpha-1 3/1 6-mannosyltransferase alg-2 [Mortierella sp. NVP85]|nr:Alpha-1 3/1 6-mannosyltransferase alg-2 [Mortierella sp. NVP85]
MASQPYNHSYNKPLPQVSPQMQNQHYHQHQQYQQHQHPQHQHHYQPQHHHPQHQQSPHQPYNHYDMYKQGSLQEQQYQQQQYQQYQNAVQQQQHRSTGSQQAAVQSSLKDWFDAVDTDRSGNLTCEELQRALMNGDWTPFNVETVRLMMNMFDRDNDGTISFNEFIGLWNYIEKWKACFQTYDLDGSGTIDTMELQKALRGFGYNLSEQIVALIVTKFDVRGRGDISFDNFVQSCVTVQTLTDAFRRIDVAGTGVVTMTYEQFLGLVINNR